MFLLSYHIRKNYCFRFDWCRNFRLYWGNQVGVLIWHISQLMLPLQHWHTFSIRRYLFCQYWMCQVHFKSCLHCVITFHCIFGSDLPLIPKLWALLARTIIPYLSPCLPLCVSLSVCPYIYMSICLAIHLHVLLLVCLSLSVSACLHVSLVIWLSNSVSACFLRPSVRPPASFVCSVCFCLSVALSSICLSILNNCTCHCVVAWTTAIVAVTCQSLKESKHGCLTFRQ